MDLSNISTDSLEGFRDLIEAEIEARRNTPKPFYSNHPKTKPTVGDTVRLADDKYGYNLVWFYTRKGWISTNGSPIAEPFDGIRPGLCELLIDGDTVGVVRARVNPPV